MADKNTIRQQAFGAVLRNAILSWQIAFTVIFTALLFLFVPEVGIPIWQPWFWLVGGGLAAVAFILATITDPQAAQEAITREFEKQYELRDINNRVARQHVSDALEYRRNMLTLAKRGRGSLRTHLLQTVEDVNDWISHMYDLAKHIDSFEDNELVERDRRNVPMQIEKVKIRIEREENEAVKRDLQQQVEQLEQQLTNLEATINSVRRAEIQLESTLSSLGTIYAQMARLGTKEVDSSRAQRLRLEIQDEVSSLQDTIEAMDEVQAQSLRIR